MGSQIAITDEAQAALIEWQEANEALYHCKKRLRDAESTLNWMTQDPTHFRPMSDFELKDFNAIEDAYVMAYNDGHRDGRNSAGYNPKIQKWDRETFRQAYKLRSEDWDDVDDATWEDSYDPQAVWEQIWDNWQDDWMFGEAQEDIVDKIAEAVVKNNPTVVIEDSYDWYLQLSPEAREDLLSKPYLYEVIDEDIERIAESWDEQFMSEDPNTDWDPTGEERRLMMEKCEDERSFLISILSDRQLGEFLEYEEESYSAETKLMKKSCCCGATEDNPCRCMKDGPMNCSAVEPKCPCYQDLEKNAESDKTWNCVICGDKCAGYGHNPAPVALHGRCCDVCNSIMVIPARLNRFSWSAEEDCACPVCGTTTEVVREWYNDDTAYVDLVVCDNCYWMEELEENDEAYDAYMEEMLALLDEEEPDPVPNVVVDTSWDWSDGVGPPSSQQTLDLDFEAEVFEAKSSWPKDDVCDKCTQSLQARPWTVETTPVDDYTESIEDRYFPTKKSAIDYIQETIQTYEWGNAHKSGFVRPVYTHEVNEEWWMGGGYLGYDPEDGEFTYYKPTETWIMDPDDYDLEEPYKEWSGDAGAPQAFTLYAGPGYRIITELPKPWPTGYHIISEESKVMESFEKESDAKAALVEYRKESPKATIKKFSAEWRAEGDEELTDEEKQEVWNQFQEEAASLEDPNLEKIKILADKYLTDVIDDDAPEFFVDPGLEDYYQFILTDPTYPEGGEPEDEEAAAMFAELKQVRYWATILTDRHIEEADTAAKAMIAAGLMGQDEKLFKQGMLGLETNNQVQRERELLAQWLAEGGVHGCC